MEERKIRRLDGGALWTYAVKVLAGRAHSTGELREKLRRRAERAADVDEVLPASRKSATWTTAATPRDSPRRAWPTRNSAGRASFKTAATPRGPFPGPTHGAEGLPGRRRGSSDRRSHPPQIPPGGARGAFSAGQGSAAAYRRLLHAGFRSGESFVCSNDSPGTRTCWMNSSRRNRKKRFSPPQRRPRRPCVPV